MGGSRSLAITESFYAWELRGRGWQVAPYPVVLEPPFRYAALLPAHAPPTEPIDDGHRPTFLSSLFASIRESFLPEKTPSSEPVAFEEPEAHPFEDDGALVSFDVRVAESHSSGSDVAEHLLRALSSALGPVSIEFVAMAGRVALQVTCREGDRALVRSSLEGYVPEASVVEGEDRLRAAWCADAPAMVVDFGLSDEFFLPLRAFLSFRIDPYIPLIAGLAEAEDEEVVAFQVLFERAHNPWAKATQEALSDGQGGSVFADAPEFLPLSREKLRSPLFSSVVRVGACARTRARAFELVRGTGPFALQFERSGSNALLPLENTDYPDRLHAEALLDRTSYRFGMLLSADELVGLVHVPDASVRHPAFEREVRRSKRAPPFAVGHGYALGTNLHRGEAVTVSLDEARRLQHMHVLGASGTGKSTLLVELIGQDLEAGRGVAVLDPHGDLVEDVLARVPEERIGDVVLFDPSDEEFPIGLNILSAKTTFEKELLASDLVNVFQRLSTSWGDSMGAVLSNAILAVLEHRDGGTLLDLRRFLVDDAFRRAFLAGIDDEEVQLFWTKSFSLVGSRSIGPILTRLDAFLRPKLVRHIAGQKVPKLDLGEVLADGKIFLAKLSQGLIGAENASLLGSLIATRLHQLALARQAQAKATRRAFFLYADEAQYFVTPSMAALLTDVRKYGLGLVLAHQNLFQIRGSVVESALLGNAFTRIAFRVGDEDAKKLAEGCSYFDSGDFRTLGLGEAIVRLGSAANDFNLKTIVRDAVPPEEASAKREAIVAASRDRFARPLAEVKIALGMQAHPRDAVPEAAPPLPPTLPTAPVQAPTESVAALPPEAKRSDRRAQPVEPAPLGRGGHAHKYLQHLVKRLAEERGFRAVIEAPAGEGQVDVGLERGGLSIAVEVSVTTDPAHEHGNIKKCLASGFQHVVLLVPEGRRAGQCRQALAELLAIEPVRVLEPSDFAEYLDAFAVPEATQESTVRGYKVRVNRQAFTPEEAAAKRQAVAKTIARSLKGSAPR